MARVVWSHVIGPVSLESTIVRFCRASSPELVTVNWYGMVVPAVITAGSAVPLRSTCLTSWSALSGDTVVTRTCETRWTSVDPPVEADRRARQVGCDLDVDLPLRGGQRRRPQRSGQRGARRVRIGDRLGHRRVL